MTKQAISSDPFRSGRAVEIPGRALPFRHLSLVLAHPLLEGIHHLAHGLLNIHPLLRTESNGTVHLINESTIAAGVPYALGNRLHPPLAEVRIQDIEAEGAVSIGKLARFGMDDQELLEFGI